MPTQHAKLSPSGSKLWLNCPGSVRMQADCPDERGEAAAKGTGAHALGEACLKRGHECDQYIGWWCGECPSGADFLTKDQPSGDGVMAFQIDVEMAQNVQIYVNHVREMHASMPGSTMELEVESKVDEHIWGTTDAKVGQMFGPLHIIDYKNGYTHVDEINNSQLMIYALGSLDPAMEYTGITTCIVQPNSPYGAPVRSHTYSLEELLVWRTNVLLPAAKAALAPDAPCIPGDWCKDGWCKARAICPALTGHLNEVAQGMFSPVQAERPTTLPLPQNMTPEQRGFILDNKKLLIDFLGTVEKFECSLAHKGQNTWGKFVKGKSSRAFENEMVAAERLTAMLGESPYERTMLSPAKAEKALKARGKDPKDIADLIRVTPGKPRFVSVTDKGAAINPADGMFIDTTAVSTSLI